jgi:hypothetical protein
MDTLSYPTRYERYAQILIYPKADQAYTVRCGSWPTWRASPRPTTKPRWTTR